MGEFQGGKTYMVSEVDLGRAVYSDEYVRWLESEVERVRQALLSEERAHMRTAAASNGRCARVVGERDVARQVAREMYAAWPKNRAVPWLESNKWLAE